MSGISCDWFDAAMIRRRVETTREPVLHVEDEDGGMLVEVELPLPASIALNLAMAQINKDIAEANMALAQRQMLLGVLWLLVAALWVITSLMRLL